MKQQARRHRRACCLVFPLQIIKSLFLARAAASMGVLTRGPEEQCGRYRVNWCGGDDKAAVIFLSCQDRTMDATGCGP